MLGLNGLWSVGRILQKFVHLLGSPSIPAKAVEGHRAPQHGTLRQLGATPEPAVIPSNFRPRTGRELLLMRHANAPDEERPWPAWPTDHSAHSRDARHAL